MWTWCLLIGVAGHHIIPSLLASAITYLILSLLLRLGSLRRPAWRVRFLYAALAKAALSLWAGSSVSSLTYHSGMIGYLGVRMPNLVPAQSWLEPALSPRYQTVSALSGWVLGAILVVGAALLCYRWARLAPLYHSVYASLRADGAEAAAAEQVFAELLSRLRGWPGWLPLPRLLVIHGSPFPAFTVGLRPPIIVLSANLVSQLSGDEVTGVLAHELAHVRRLDYLGRWLATILRDIMIWNPAAVLWYEQLLEEQERASDVYAAEHLADPAAVAGGLVEAAAYAVQLRLLAAGPLTAWRNGRALYLLESRLRHLENSGDRPSESAGWPAYPLRVLLAAFVLAQPYVALSVPGLYSLLMLSR